ncbi:phosphate ABC transporter permease PstA [Azoarcus sp. DN11]|uniref:phosphate ABC transporter permease PstA n=1 Tax=Azoarcus sp. DN11 TaxID=356837 RepID=UPI000EB12BE2|nr:phosphate ABC transporter permease PstA [Azoarcus sp. DN11]AYH42184.1 phosphate ABC transporter, permease protein PstA [Azoarcus sp. DN11]
MKPALHKHILRRKIRDRFAKTLSAAAVGFALFWLSWILWVTLAHGLTALKPELLTHMTPPPGEEGGLANALFGSLTMSFLAIVMAVPIGIAAGTYLAETAQWRALRESVRFVNDILLSAPSIIIGLFVYTLLVRPFSHFSGWAGAVALALIALPVVVRTTDEMLRLVPAAMREAALSLGIPQWKVTTHVLYRAALPGIITGIMLALARISGETAPLLFTALNNQYWSTDLGAPLASVPVVIFQYAMSPYEEWHALAWAGAFAITLLVLVLSLIARSVVAKRRISHE